MRREVAAVLVVLEKLAVRAARGLVVQVALARIHIPLSQAQQARAVRDIMAAVVVVALVLLRAVEVWAERVAVVTVAQPDQMLLVQMV